LRLFVADELIKMQLCPPGWWKRKGLKIGGGNLG
jgi:hypothetical protein